MDKLFANSSTTVAAIQAALTPVAEKIGQGAQFVWATVVQQQYIYGIVSMFWAACAFACLVFGLMKVWPWAKTCAEDSDGVSYGIAVVFILVSSVLFVATATHGIEHLLNPNYYALQFFVGLVKPAAN